jgi:hypothetical protein
VAHGVDAIHAAASELVLLTGATWFTAASPLTRLSVA